ncbi:MAG: hypothetical protein WCJ36_01910 [Candidatus Saccharibacteria bacterium]
MSGGSTHYQSFSVKEDDRRHLQVGDIVQSKGFVVAEYNMDRTRISLGTRPKGPKIVTRIRSEEERVRMAAETGEIPSKEFPEDFSVDDETRAIAMFVVERAALEGGGTAHGPWDTYPDSRHVSVRRLNDDGSYNKNGEVIHFCENGAFDCIREPGDLEVLGKMSLTFI